MGCTCTRDAAAADGPSRAHLSAATDVDLPRPDQYQDAIDGSRFHPDADLEYTGDTAAVADDEDVLVPTNDPSGACARPKKRSWRHRSASPTNQGYLAVQPTPEEQYERLQRAAGIAGVHGYTADVRQFVSAAVVAESVARCSEWVPDAADAARRFATVRYANPLALTAIAA